MTKIAIGCDHAGKELKDYVINYLTQENVAGEQMEIDDVGTNGENSVDYPDYGAKVARAVSRNDVDKGILICGTGIGMSIVANKFKNIRAALCHDTVSARYSREHNDSNILVLGGRVITPTLAREIVKVWLTTDFEGGRHERRLKKIVDIEEGFGDES